MCDELIKAFETIEKFCLEQEKQPCNKCPLARVCYDDVITSLCEFAGDALEVLKRD